MNERQDIFACLETARETAARLPRCHRAAHLHALLARVQRAVDDGGSPSNCSSELVDAAVAALEGDPWVEFEQIARRLHDLIAAADRIPAEHGPSRS
jgi:hypothetical protein